MSLRQKLQEKKNVLESTAGKDFLTKKLKDYYHTELIFISSNIEEIVVSRDEAKDIVAQFPNFEPIPSSNIPLLQAKGQKVALEYAEDFARENQPITVEVVRTLHRMLLEEAAPEIAGRYREELVKIKGTKFMPTIHYFIPMEMAEFDTQLRKGLSSVDASAWDILEFATWAHFEVVRIHPFKDGNGRVARILYNLIFRWYNLPYVLVPKSGTEHRMWDGLRIANQGDLSQLVRYYGELLSESYDLAISECQKKL